mmetsp:Transcript_21037/g.53479  ORF Transcript_21037/g.53479 Transcript_21037/m.53479 type:complete len:323 (-) Transcript_21037:1056-2024(-)
MPLSVSGDPLAKTVSRAPPVPPLAQAAAGDRTTTTFLCSAALKSNLRTMAYADALPVVAAAPSCSPSSSPACSPCCLPASGCSLLPRPSPLLLNSDTRPRAGAGGGGRTNVCTWPWPCLLLAAAAASLPLSDAESAWLGTLLLSPAPSSSSSSSSSPLTSSHPEAANSLRSSGSPTRASPMRASPWHDASSSRSASGSAPTSSHSSPNSPGDFVTAAPVVTAAAAACSSSSAPAASTGTMPCRSSPCSVSVPVLSNAITSSWPAVAMRSGDVTNTPRPRRREMENTVAMVRHAGSAGGTAMVTMSKKRTTMRSESAPMDARM